MALQDFHFRMGMRKCTNGGTQTPCQRPSSHHRWDQTMFPGFRYEPRNPSMTPRFGHPGQIERINDKLPNFGSIVWLIADGIAPDFRHRVLDPASSRLVVRSCISPIFLLAHCAVFPRSGPQIHARCFLFSWHLKNQCINIEPHFNALVDYCLYCLVMLAFPKKQQSPKTFLVGMIPWIIYRRTNDCWTFLKRTSH